MLEGGAVAHLAIVEVGAAGVQLEVEAEKWAKIQVVLSISSRQRSMPSSVWRRLSSRTVRVSSVRHQGWSVR